MEIKIYGAFVLNLRVDLHAIDATPARWRGGRRSQRGREISTQALPRRAEATQHIGRDGKTAEYRRETGERRLGDEHLFWVSKRQMTFHVRH